MSDLSVALTPATHLTPLCDWQSAKLIKSRAVTQMFVFLTVTQGIIAEVPLSNHKLFVIVLASSGRLSLLSLMCRSSSLLVGKNYGFLRRLFFIIIIVVTIPTIPVGKKINQSKQKPQSIVGYLSNIY